MVVHRIVIRYPQGVLGRHCPLAIQTQTDSLYQKHSMTLPQRTVFGRLLRVIYHVNLKIRSVYSGAFVYSGPAWLAREKIRIQNEILNTDALTPDHDH